MSKTLFQKVLLVSISILILFELIFFCICCKVSAYEPICYGVDISEYQTVTNWNTVADNVDFVIIRVGTTTGLNNDVFREETKFKSFYAEAKNVSMAVGVYYYSGTNTLAGFEKNAQEVINLLNGRSLDYPVYLDLEQSSGQIALGKYVLTTYVLSALHIIENAGYQAGIYASQSWFTNYIDTSRIAAGGYSLWMAQYPSGSYAVNPKDYDKSNQCNMWQYSDKGAVSGISGEVDVENLSSQ